MSARRPTPSGASSLSRAHVSRVGPRGPGRARRLADCRQPLAGGWGCGAAARLRGWWLLRRRHPAADGRRPASPPACTVPPEKQARRPRLRFRTCPDAQARAAGRLLVPRTRPTAPSSPGPAPPSAELVEKTNPTATSPRPRPSQLRSGPIARPIDLAVRRASRPDAPRIGAVSGRLSRRRRASVAARRAVRRPRGPAVR